MGAAASTLLVCKRRAVTVAPAATEEDAVPCRPQTQKELVASDVPTKKTKKEEEAPPPSKTATNEPADGKNSVRGRGSRRPSRDNDEERRRPSTEGRRRSRDSLLEEPTRTRRSRDSFERSSAQPMDQHRAPPEDVLRSLVEEGRVVPCELHGPRDAKTYHRNVNGASMAFSSGEARREYFDVHRNELKKFQSWDRLDVAQTSADWAMRYGSQAFGKPFQFKKFKATLEKVRASMVRDYAKAVAQCAQREPQEYDAVVNGDAYASFSSSTAKKSNNGDHDGSSNTTTKEDDGDPAAAIIPRLPPQSSSSRTRSRGSRRTSSSRCTRTLSKRCRRSGNSSKTSGNAASTVLLLRNKIRCRRRGR